MGDLVSSIDQFPSRCFLLTCPPHLAQYWACPQIARQSILTVLIIGNSFARFHLFRNRLGWKRIRRSSAKITKDPLIAEKGFGTVYHDMT